MRLVRVAIVAGIGIGAVSLALLFTLHRGSGAHAAAPQPATPPATSCQSRLLHDWADGRIDGTYPLACYRAALRSLPADLEGLLERTGRHPPGALTADRPEPPPSEDLGTPGQALGPEDRVGQVDRAFGQLVQPAGALQVAEREAAQVDGAEVGDVERDVRVVARS